MTAYPLIRSASAARSTLKSNTYFWSISAKMPRLCREPYNIRNFLSNQLSGVLFDIICPEKLVPKSSCHTVEQRRYNVIHHKQSSPQRQQSYSTPPEPDSPPLPTPKRQNIKIQISSSRTPLFFTFCVKRSVYVACRRRLGLVCVV